MGLVDAQVLPQTGLYLCNRALQKSKVGREQRKHESLLNDLKRNQRQRRKMARRNKGNREQINCAQDVRKEKSRSQKHGERCERNINFNIGGTAGIHNRDETEQPGRKQEALHPEKPACSSSVFCAPNIEGPVPIPGSFVGKKGRNFLHKMPLGPEKFTASIKEKFSPVSGLSAGFFQMEVGSTVLITKLVDTGTKEVLGGQTPPLEMERQV